MINFNIEDNDQDIRIDLSNLDQFSSDESENLLSQETNNIEEELMDYYDSEDFFRYYNNSPDTESLIQNSENHITIDISEQTNRGETSSNLISHIEDFNNASQDININRNESIFDNLNLISENNFDELYQTLVSRVREIRDTFTNSILSDIPDNNYTLLNNENPTSERIEQDINNENSTGERIEQDINYLSTSYDHSEGFLDIESYYDKNTYEILNTYDNNSFQNKYKIGNKFAHRKLNSYKFLTNSKKEINKKTEDIHCISCYADFNDKKIIFKKINNIDKLEKQTLFAGPCGKHFICYECLKTISLSFDNHLINRNNSLIYCIGQDCLTSSGIPVYFDHYQISKVLTLEEYQNYIEYAEIYEFPGFEIVKCPNIISDFRSSYKCNTKNIIPVEKIKETPPGCLIIYCIQNRKCHNSFCYNCKQKIYSYHTKCDICFDNNEYNNPFGINRFLVKTQIDNSELEIQPELREISNQENKIIKRKILEETDYLYRNNEITVDMALEYIKQIIKSDETANRFQIQCPYCLNFFFKTEKCSALKHCGIERCYSCGKIQERNQRDLNDHWSAAGVNGCPRFDNETYWNTNAHCNFLCQDEICYSHEIGECQIEAHQTGIKNMIIERKKAFIYHFLKSLLKETRNEVLEILEEDIYQNLSNTFLQKVFSFLEFNPTYIKYYSPLVFMKELQEFYKQKVE